VVQLDIYQASDFEDLQITKTFVTSTTAALSDVRNIKSERHAIIVTLTGLPMVMARATIWTGKQYDAVVDTFSMHSGCITKKVHGGEWANSDTITDAAELNHKCPKLCSC